MSKYIIVYNLKTNKYEFSPVEIEHSWQWTPEIRLHRLRNGLILTERFLFTGKENFSQTRMNNIFDNCLRNRLNYYWPNEQRLKFFERQRNNIITFEL